MRKVIYKQSKAARKAGLKDYICKACSEEVNENDLNEHATERHHAGAIRIDL